MFRFYDATIDTNLFLQLQDLASVLSRQTDMKFEYSYGSSIDVLNRTISGSSFWDVHDQAVKVAGYKTDILLRTIGNLHYTNLQVMKDFSILLNDMPYPSFASQLVTLFENIRLEEQIKKDRPGTANLFEARKTYLDHYFTSQLKTNVTRGYTLDELFCLIYLSVEANEPDPSFPTANKEQLLQLDHLKSAIFSLFDAKSTGDVVGIVERIISQLDDYKDLINTYFIFPITHVEQFSKNNLFDELTRTDPLANDDMQEVDQEKNEYFDETFSTWHRENKNEEQNQTFLQFDLERGTKTDILGGGARETEDGDQAMGSIQGSSGESNQKDYSKLETLEKKETKKGKSSTESPYGEENKHASIHIKKTKPSSSKEKEAYKQMTSAIDPIRRKLAKTIENTLEHKQNMPRENLAMGRLSKNLLPIVFEDNPRIFYKKDHESKEIDAVFTLLVDCSASMHNKMEETKRGITLFHEVLKQLHIPHSIIGFWEDAVGAKDDDQPNYFHLIHSFKDSLYKDNGANIMQLEPEEDNRDGFSIRVVTKELEARSEKNKFLLVFSDGEPAAMNYEENGIVDTHQAVSEARKKGIDVIGMFLANDDVNENEDTMMKNIYGRKRVMVPNIEELPEQFAPLIKKLLLKAI